MTSVENGYKIFDYLFEIFSVRLGIGYGKGVGFCSVVNFNTPQEELFKIKENHVKCLIRKEILNDISEGKCLDLLLTQSNKTIELMILKMLDQIKNKSDSLFEPQHYQSRDIRKFKELK